MLYRKAAKLQRKDKEMETETSYWVVQSMYTRSMLAVVAADVAGQGPLRLERRKFGTTANQVRELAAWLGERNVREVVMESTALILEAGMAGVGGTVPAVSGAGAL